MSLQSFITLGNLEVYKLSIQLSKSAWEIFQNLEWIYKKTIGIQFLEATDSIGGNIAEGYGRFHYLDKIKFFYNSRGSLLESRHWFNLLADRNLVKNAENRREYLEAYKIIRPLLNGLIHSTYKQKKELKPS